MGRVKLRESTYRLPSWLVLAAVDRLLEKQVGLMLDWAIVSGPRRDEVQLTDDGARLLMKLGGRLRF